MSSINEITTPGMVRNILPFQRAADEAPVETEYTAPAATAVDRVEISEEAASLAEREQAIRFEKVARIRALIQDGTYDVNSKLELILDRLLKDLT